MKHASLQFYVCSILVYYHLFFMFYFLFKNLFYHQKSEKQCYKQNKYNVATKETANGP